MMVAHDRDGIYIIITAHAAQRAYTRLFYKYSLESSMEESVTDWLERRFAQALKFGTPTAVDGEMYGKQPHWEILHNGITFITRQQADGFHVLVTTWQGKRKDRLV